MKMNKILSMLMVVVTLSALAVKSEASFLDDLTKTPKENVSFFKRIANQSPLKINALTMDGSICSNVSAITPDPNTEIVFTAEGGTFTATVRHTPYIEQTIGLPDTFCNVNGVIYSQSCYPVLSTHKFNSDYVNSYTGKPQLRTGYNGFEYIKYECEPNTSSSDLTGFVTIGGRKIPYRVNKDKTDFKLMDWIKRKLSSPRTPGPCVPGSITNPCKKNAAFGIRG